VGGGGRGGWVGVGMGEREGVERERGRKVGGGEGGRRAGREKGGVRKREGGRGRGRE